jgi:HEAT repeat protein
MQASLSLTQRDREQVEEIRALADGGDVTSLIDRLRTARWPARRAAVSALAALGDAAVKELCSALVSQRNDEGQIAAIVDALSLSTADVRAAMESLATHDACAVVCDAATILGRHRYAESVPTLARLTAHADDNVAVAAVEALGRIGGEAAVDALLALAATGSFFRVYPTIDVLGRCGDTRATEVLARLLDDSLYAADAARALGRTGDDRAIDALLKLLVRSSESVVRVAAVALTETHDRLYGRFAASSGSLMHRAPSSPVAKLLQALSSADQHEEIAIVRLLGLLGDDEATAALIDLVIHGQGRAVAAAESALRELGTSALVPLLDAIRDGDSEARSILLPLIGPRSTDADPIIACVTDPSARVRTLAIDTLARMGTTRAVPLLFEALRDSDLRVSQAAVAAIQSLGSDQSETLAIAAAGDENPTVRRAGIRVLAYFGYPGALEPLLAAVSDRDERVREVALGGLPLLADARADQAIYAALRDSSERTRAA